MTAPAINTTFENLINLLGVYSEGTARMAELEAENNKAYLDLVEERKDEYAKLQLALGEAEAAIKVIADAHPEWFPTDQRTLKTPYGSVHAQKTTKHEADDEEVSILLIEADADLAARAGDLAAAQALTNLVKVEKTIDFEAIAKLDAARLAQWRIRRTESDSITVKPAKVSLGNAVKAADKKTKGKAKKTAEVGA